MCTFVARLAKLRPVIVTYFTAPSNYDRVKAEIARDFLPGEEDLLVIALDEAGSKSIYDTSVIEPAFEKAWVKMFNDEPLQCVKTGRIYEPVAMFFRRSLETVIRLGPSNVKTYNWLPVTTLMFSSLGLIGDDPEPFIRAQAESRGVPFDNVALELFSAATGRVVDDQVNPPIYDWENHPQAADLPADFIGGVVMMVPGALKKSHGAITFDAALYAPKATDLLRTWYGETGRKAFYAGPLLPQTPEDTSADPRAKKIQDFLDEHLVSHGKRSVIYVAFGSLFWPSDNAKIWAMLEVLIEKNIPFVMSCGAALSTQSPADIQEKLTQYKHAIITEWVPQQALLEHPATGWYISHGGHNSALEAINAVVPMILWPIAADQPVNAVHLADTLDVAYELIEVRHGSGLGKIYRTGRTPIGTVDAVKAELREVLDRAFGEDGARKRENLVALHKTLQTAWAEDGDARRDVEAFLDDI
ncbi:UDP-Glycosyltransferase/glycogen phosphorylase [Earliella scabrosa]|nr:UDP-Glycosyltransferase/glycogen phosphorylase [Earliella scabrosa]